MKDLVLDENLDLKIKNGDVVFDEATMQTLENVLDTNKGEWKDNVRLGVGIKKYLAANNSINELRGEIIENLKRVDIKHKKIGINKDKEIEVKVE